MKNLRDNGNQLHETIMSLHKHKIEKTKNSHRPFMPGRQQIIDMRDNIRYYLGFTFYINGRP